MSSYTISVREARQDFRRWLDRAAAGAEVRIERRGELVARLVGPDRERPRPRDLTAFRASIKIKGLPMSEEILRARRSARY